MNRAPVQPAFKQPGIKVEATPANVKRINVSAALRRLQLRPMNGVCPNPQCGKLIPAGKKFCMACGTQSGFKVEATPVNVASPKVRPVSGVL